MKRKILSALLCVAMTATMLAGCGGEAKDSTDDKQETTDDTAGDDAATDDAAGDDAAGDDAADDSAGGDQKLTVWCWDPAFNIFSMEEAGKVYQADHPEFSVEVVETPWDDIQTKLTTAATSGDLSTMPDIILMQDNAFQKNVISYPEAFVDLTDSGVDFSQFSEAKTAYQIGRAHV